MTFHTIDIFVLNFPRGQLTFNPIPFIIASTRTGGDTLANIKSAKKRIKVIAKKTLRNKMIKSGTKTAIKKVISAVESGVKENAISAYRNAASAIDKATTKGVYHKNTAARRKSRLAKMVNKVGA
jgi:small subunit ribosomal protein S20